MANTTVGIVFEVYNRGTRGLTSINKDVSTIGRSLRSLTTTALGLAGVGSIGYVLAKTAQHIDNTAKAADRLGMATEQFSGLQYAANLAGVEVSQLDGNIERMVKSVADAARGSGEGAVAIKELGISARSLSAGNAAETVYRLADAFAAVPSQIDRTRIAIRLFGQSGAEMATLLGQGSAALRAQQDEAEKLGLAFNRIDAAKVEEANDALTRLKGLGQGLTTRAVIEMAPYVEALATQLVDAATAAGGFGEVTTRAMESASMGAARLLDTLEKIENLKRLASAAGYRMEFRDEIDRQTKDVYESEIRREGKNPWSAPLFHRRATAMFPSRYDEIAERVTGYYAPSYDPLKANAGENTPSNVREVEDFFAGVRKRAAESQQRAAEAAQRVGTKGISSDGAFAETTRATTIDVAAAYARMYKDIDSKSAASFDARRQLLMAEYDQYAQVIGDKAALAEWLAVKERDLAIEEAKATGGFLDGVRAGLAEMKRDLPTIGELGADVAKNGVAGISEGLADAVFEAERLDDAMRNVLKASARAAFEWSSTKMLLSLGTAVASAFSGGGMANEGKATVAKYHSGTRSVGTGGATMRVPASLFDHAPRLHEGLASDEFPAILQRGEEVRSRSQVARGGDGIAALAAKLDALIELGRQRQTVKLDAAIVDGRQTPREFAESREGRRIAARNAAQR